MARHLAVVVVDWQRTLHAWALVEKEAVELVAALAHDLLALQADGNSRGASALGVAAQRGVFPCVAVELVENFEVFPEWTRVACVHVDQCWGVGGVERTLDSISPV